MDESLSANLAVTTLTDEQILWLSIQMFWVMELAMLAVSVVLGLFVVREYIGKDITKPVSPLRFLTLAGMTIGLTAAFSAYWGLNHLIFAFAFGLGMTLSLVDPVAALGFLIANLLIRPWELNDMAQLYFIPKTLAGLTLFSWIFHRARARKLTFLMDTPSRIFYAMAIWFFFSAMTAGNYEQTMADFTASVLIAAVVFLLVTNVPEKENDVRLLERVLVIAVTGSIAHALFVTLGQDGFTLGIHRLMDTGQLGNSNDLASLITQALPLALIPAIQGGRRLGTRLIAFVVMPIFLVGLWISQSRGAMLSVAVSGVVFFILRAKNKKRAITWAVVCIPLLVLFSEALKFARGAGDLEHSSESRWSFIIAGLNMGIRNPLTGAGWDNFPLIWQQYAIGDIFETGFRTAHNSWVLAFAETGFPGLILLISLFRTTFHRAQRVKASHPELICAQVGYAVAMTFLSHCYEIFPYLLFGLILATHKIKVADDRRNQLEVAALGTPSLQGLG